MNTYLDDWKVERAKITAMQERERELARVESERTERDRAQAEAAEAEAKKPKPAPKPQPTKPKPSPRPEPRCSYRKEMANALAAIGMSAAEIAADLNEREMYVRRHIAKRKKETCGTGIGSEVSSSDTAITCAILGHSRETRNDLRFVPRLASAATIIVNRASASDLSDDEFLARVYTLADVSRSYVLDERAVSALRGLV